MSGIAAGRGGPRRGRWSDLLISLVMGVVVVTAALVPAATASSGETVTVRGDVTRSGTPLRFFPVGFWSTTQGVVQSSTTDVNGRFTLDLPATVDGFAFAGSAPDAARAITAVDGHEVVRGIIGAAAASGTSWPLYQGRVTATARGLAGGAAQLRFRLQDAGRIAGTSPVPAADLLAVQVRRADNSVVESLRLDAKGRFRSQALTPGQYAVVLVPRSPDLPTVADAVVQGGRTTTVQPATPVVGATVAGTVMTATGVVGSVPVLLEQGDDVVASTTASSSGAWRFPGLAAGDYTVEVGRYDKPAATSASAIEVPIPGASPSPSPTAMTPTSAASTVAPENAAIEPVEVTADAVEPATFDVTVPEGLGDVTVATEVEAAGRITGTVSRAGELAGSGSAPIRVVVEEAATRRIVRVATATGSPAGYSVGGLLAGERYRVYAVTEPDDPTLAEMGGTAVVALTTSAVADIVLDEPALTVNGTVAGVTDGTVLAGDRTLFQRTGTIDESGAYAVQGLVPGAYPVVVTSGDRETSEPVAVPVASAEPVVDLQPGPEPATFKGWFIASGAGVPVVVGTAVDDDGDVVRFGPDTADGEVTIHGLRPGTYAYDADSFRGTVPALDGPWYYEPPAGTFSLSDGATTDVGPIVLHARAH